MAVTHPSSTRKKGEMKDGRHDAPIVTNARLLLGNGKPLWWMDGRGKDEPPDKCIIAPGVVYAGGAGWSVARNDWSPYLIADWLDKGDGWLWSEWYWPMGSSEWMDGWMVGWMDGWMDEWMNGRMGGWMDEWMDGWMNGWWDVSFGYHLKKWKNGYFSSLLNLQQLKHEISDLTSRE